MRLIFVGLCLTALSFPALADTLPTPPPARIALLSDIHTTRSTNDDQPLFRGRLDKAIQAVNEAKVDVVLIAGDLTDTGSAEEVADFKDQIKGFKPPVRYVPGNHDVGNKRVQGKDNQGGPDPFRLSRFEMRAGLSFFVHECAGVRIIGLNSPILGSGLAREKKMWRFLEQQLARPHALPTVLFTHYPPFLKNPDEPGEYFNIEPEPRQRLLGLCEQGGVKAVLSGHLHRSITNQSNGIVFITTGPVSRGLPKGKEPQGWTLVTVAANGEVHGEFHEIKD